MAVNFRIASKELDNQCTALKLFGDFDGSSAWELINALDQNTRETGKIAINTDGLRAIHPFGLDVFLPNLSKMKKTRVNIQVTGRFREVFQDI
jgi:anti-anti-sigma regulatory factor